MASIGKRDILAKATSATSQIKPSVAGESASLQFRASASSGANAFSQILFENNAGSVVSQIKVMTETGLRDMLITTDQTPIRIVGTGFGGNIVLESTEGHIDIGNLIWPSADGTAEQVLATDGSGNLYFRDVSGTVGGSLGDLDDVEYTPAPSPGSLLIYDGSLDKWHPTTPNSGADVRRIYVSSENGSDVNGSGTALNPYETISKALSIIAASVGVGEFNTDAIWNVIIGPGVYDEDISVPTNANIGFIATGKVVVGFSGSSTGFVTIPHIELEADVQRSIYFSSDSYNPNTDSSSSAFVILGDVIYSTGSTILGNNGSHVVSFNGVQVRDIMHTGDNSPINVQCNFNSTNVRSINFPSLSVVDCRISNFSSSVSIGQYRRLSSSTFSSTFVLWDYGIPQTTSEAYGIYNTTFKDAITITSNVLAIDSTTWTHLNRYSTTINGLSAIDAKSSGLLDVMAVVSLFDLYDLDYTIPPAVGDTLKFDGTVWYPEAPSSNSGDVDGVYWDNTGTSDKGLTNNGRLVTSINEVWNSVIQMAETLEYPDKFYTEVSVTSSGGNDIEVGLTTDTLLSGQPSLLAGYVSVAYGDNSLYVDGVSTATFTSFTLNATDVPSVVMIAYDKFSGNIWIGYNGVWDASGDPTSGANPTATIPDLILNHKLFASPYTLDSTVLSPTNYEYTVPTDFAGITSVTIFTGSLADLNDTTIVNPRDDHYLGYDGTEQRWVNQYISYNQLTDKVGVSGLSDVLLTTLSNQHILQWNGSKWVNIPVPSTINKLDDLSDVIVSITPSANDHLVYSSGYWRNTQVFIPSKIDDLTDVDTGVVKSPNEVMTWDGSKWYSSAVSYTNLTNKPFIPTNINSLTDVDVATVPPVSNVSTLRWNGTNWVPYALPTNASFTLTGLSDTSASPVANGILVWNGTGNLIEYKTSITAGSVSGLSPVATSGNYNDLSNKPTIPTNGDFLLSELGDTSALPISNGYLQWNSDGSLVEYKTSIPSSSITGLATVATSGSYTDLSNTPTLPTNSDFSLLGLNDTSDTPVNSGYLRWNIIGGSIIYEADIPANVITGLATVATSGAYADLSGSPDVPEILSDMADVVVDGLAVGHILKWDGLNWTASVDVDTKTISGLTDTTISGRLADETLLWNGSTWINAYPDYAKLRNLPTPPTNADYTFRLLSDTSNTAIANGYLRWNGTGTSVTYSTTIPSTAITGLSTVATTGSYADLSNKPTIPTAIGQLNDVTIVSPITDQALAWTGSVWANRNIAYGSISGKPDLSIYARSADLSAVATSGLIDSLLDVDTTTAAPSDGDSLVYSDASSAWIPGLPSATVASLGDIGDVDVTGLTDEQVLKWNSGQNKWLPANDLVGGGGGGATILDELNDVTISGLQDRHYLVYNSGTSKWLNVWPNYADILNTPFIPAGLGDMADVDLVTTPPVKGSTLKYGGSAWESIEPLDPAVTRAIYVAVSGNDNDNNGSFMLPYRTLEKAVARAKEVIALDNLNTASVAIRMYAGLYAENNPIIVDDHRIIIESDVTNTARLMGTNPGAILQLSSSDVLSGPGLYGIALVSSSVVPGNDGILLDGGGYFILDSLLISGFDVGLRSTATVPGSIQYLYLYASLVRSSNTAVRCDYATSDFNCYDVHMADMIDAGIDVTAGTVHLTTCVINCYGTKLGGAIGLRISSGKAQMIGARFEYCATALSQGGDGIVVMSGSSLDENDIDFAQTPDITGITRINSTIIDDKKIVFYDESLVSMSTNSSASVVLATQGVTTKINSGKFYSAYGTPELPTYSFGTGFDLDGDDINYGLYCDSDTKEIGLSSNGTAGLTLSTLGVVNIPGDFTVQGNSLNAIAFSGSYDDLTNTPAIPTFLDDLGDVSTDGAVDSNILRYNGSNWVPSVEVDTNTLTDLQDTLISGRVAGQALVWSGSIWSNTNYNYDLLSNKPNIPTNSSFTLVGLSDTAGSIIPNGYLRWNGSGTQVQYSATIPTTAITGLASVATVGTIDSLTDVTTAGVADGNVLRWSTGAGQWQASAEVGVVQSVFSRTGAVVATVGDYGSNQITNQSAVSGATVSAAINTLNTSKLSNVSGTNGNFTSISGTQITDSGLSSGSFATAAQGTKADSATQPGTNISVFTNNSGYLTSISNQPIGALSNVDDAGVADGQVLIWNSTAGQYLPGTVEGGGSGATLATLTTSYYAEMFSNPLSTDWPVNTFAPMASDTTYSSLMVRNFVVASPTGLGFMVRIPASAANIQFKLRGRANDSSGGTVVFRIYTRKMPNGTAMPSWVQTIAALTCNMAANTNYVEHTFTNSLASIGLTPGDTYNYEIVRQTTVDSHTGTFSLLGIDILYT